MGIWEPDWLAEGGKGSDWARVITTYNEMKTVIFMVVSRIGYMTISK